LLRAASLASPGKREGRKAAVVMRAEDGDLLGNGPGCFRISLCADGVRQVGDEWLALVASDCDARIDRNGGEQRHAVFLHQAVAATLTEQIVLLVTAVANEVA